MGQNCHGSRHSLLPRPQRHTDNGSFRRSAMVPTFQMVRLRFQQVQSPCPIPGYHLLASAQPWRSPNLTPAAYRYKAALTELWLNGDLVPERSDKVARSHAVSALPWVCQLVSSLVNWGPGISLGWGPHHCPLSSSPAVVTVLYAFFPLEQCTQSRQNQDD